MTRGDAAVAADMRESMVAPLIETDRALQHWRQD
jgi:hypothetical protein